MTSHTDRKLSAACLVGTDVRRRASVVTPLPFSQKPLSDVAVTAITDIAASSEVSIYLYWRAEPVKGEGVGVRHSCRNFVRGRMQPVELVCRVLKEMFAHRC